MIFTSFYKECVLNNSTTLYKLMKNNKRIMSLTRKECLSLVKQRLKNQEKKLCMAKYICW